MLITFHFRRTGYVVPEIAEVRLARPRAIADEENFILNRMERKLVYRRGGLLGNRFIAELCWLIEVADGAVFHLRCQSPLYSLTPLVVYIFIPRFRHSNSRTRQRLAANEGNPWLGIRFRRASCKRPRR